ncbi:hypothetical protein L873DRAFT_1834083 [Choiromyces venosus 120613-1]|uniref:F-box domain-containing protein n=1 Tax=Choiromyces venosus 120613-1 TaxID=1336337 RepID=A0A3N4JW82_9PEZI|nr:hypothetical protein L873DRAFT_1834083 [Choiromyces venosus 120613-1]
MLKRSAPESPEQPAKRHRPNTLPYITRLSDELLLRIASFLHINDLASCQRVSKRFQRIACDGQIWKALFYARFVRPRASRIPGLTRAPPSSLHYSSRNSRWLQDEGLARATGTKWKELYRLRHNWNRGSCSVSQIIIAENIPLPPPIPPLMIRGLVFTVDSTSGLRVWRLEHKGIPVIGLDLYQGSLEFERYGIPTALAIDEDSDVKQAVNVAVGFENGGFGLYQLDIATGPLPKLTFEYSYAGPAPSAGNSSSQGLMITSMAYCSPYLLTMSSSQLFTVYRFSRSADKGCSSTEEDVNKDISISDGRMMHAPKILSSLRSHTVWPPLSLSLRRSAQKSMIASIVYAFPLYISGWSVGIQELRFTGDADTVVESRVATAVPLGFTPFGKTTSGGLSPVGSLAPPIEGGGGIRSGSKSQRNIKNDIPLAQPSSISYTHPYLLASHADNTLTLYMVKSNAASLSIESGQRLWGHTSSVSTAQVSGRGKAVSLSKRGSELRVWELEGGISERRRLNASVKVEPQVSRQTDVRSHWSVDDMGWLGGFDEEKVVVLREQDEGRRALIVYDFTL